MAVNFDHVPSATGFFAPTRFEADVFDCEVVGKIPTEIDGAFYRVGADWFYPPNFIDDALPMNGDGWVGMFRLKNGNCDFKGRFVRTPRYVADRKARRQLFGRYRNRITDDPSVRQLSSTLSNTQMYVHAGKLYALKDDGMPAIMDPNTLETKGYEDFGGKYTGTSFGAHPKTDPVTGDMICIATQVGGLLSCDIVIHTVDSKGRVKHEMRVTAPYVSMVHDIAISQKHIVIPVYGLTSSPEHMAAGKSMWEYNDKVPSYVGVLARDGDGKDIKWFHGAAGKNFCNHTFNAETVGDTVVMEAPVSDTNLFPWFPNADGTPFNGPGSRTVVRRWTFDINGKVEDGWKEEFLFPNAPGALGRIDDRYTSLPYRWGFMNYTDPVRPYNETKGGNLRGRVSNCIARFDMKSGKMDSYFVGETHSLAEAVFVPRKADAPEGDGYVIAVANNFAEMHSELIIADAQRLGEGDVARVKLPFRLSSQVHGWWAPAHTLPFTEPV
ncbi:MAG: carotenoid oxygenase family protein [Caulobacteraceae bacterium]